MEKYDLWGGVRMKRQNKILLFSFSLPLFSVFFGPVSSQQFGPLYEYAFGFPLRFIWYRSINEPLESHWALFSFEKIAHLQVDLLSYFLAVLLTYLVSRFLFEQLSQWLHKHVQSGLL